MLLLQGKQSDSSFFKQGSVPMPTAYFFLQAFGVGTLPCLKKELSLCLPCSNSMGSVAWAEYRVQALHAVFQHVTSLTALDTEQNRTVV